MTADAPVSPKLGWRRRELMRLAVSRDRGMTLAGAACTIAAFAWGYHSFLWQRFAYFNFYFVPHGLLAQSLVAVVSIAPATWLSTRVRRPSSFVCWILYLTVYIPSVFTVVFASDHVDTGIVSLLAALLSAMAILGIASSLPLLRLPRVQLSAPVYWETFTVLAAGSGAVALKVYGGHLALVNFLGGYQALVAQRLAARDIEAGHSFLGYAVSFLAIALAPTLMAYGLFRKRTIYFVAGAAAELFLYSTAGMKATVLSIPLALVVFWLVRRNDGFAATLSWAAGVALALFTIIGTSDSVVGLILGSLVLLRTFGTPGQATYLYYKFFSSHPLTYFSHVRGFSSLVHYPYRETLPFVIGMYYWNSPDLSANAHFWAMDGLAALGVVGIPVITVFVGFVFWLLDSATSHLDARFVAVAIAYQALALCNGSIFTVLLTGGLAAQMLLLYLMPTFSTDTVGVAQAVDPLPLHAVARP